MQDFNNIMKHLLTVLFFISAASTASLSAQNCNIIATANPAVVCYGGSSTITAQGFINSSNYNFDFNNSQLPSGWTTGGNTFFSSPCGPSPSGSPYYWAGTSTGTPNITTNPLNITSGGTIQFQMRYAIQGGVSPCEGPDLAHEGVSLQYSINGGASWVDITYFSPGGFQLPTNPGTTGSVAVGPTPYTSWVSFSIPIPPAAQTPNTQIRWIQFNSSGGCCDNWGLDNIQVNAGAPVNYNWSTGQSGTNATSFSFTNLQQDTCVIISVSDSLGNGCTDTVCITVIPPPDPDLITPSPTCVGSMQFDASNSIPSQPGLITQYIYDIGNNGSLDLVTNQPISSYNFTQPGVFPVMMYITTQANCQGQELFSVTVLPNPTLTLSYAPNPVCANNPVTLIDNAVVNNPNPNNNVVTSVSWDMNNDGIPEVTGPSNSSQYTFANAFNYVVTATATTDAGCTASQQTVIFVQQNPTASFSFSGLCEGDVTQFTNTSTTPGYALTGWSWDFGDGNAANGTQTQNNYATSGTYPVSLIVSGPGGCIDTAVMPVTVAPQPMADFLLPDSCGLSNTFTDNTQIASGNIAQYAWNFGDNGTSGMQHPTHAYAQSGNYPVTLIVTSAAGCNDTVVKPWTNFDVPVASFTAPPVCLNQVTQFTDNTQIAGGSVVTWDWNLNGNQLSGNSPSYTFTQEGSFPVTLVVESDHGCVDSIQQNVVVNPLPVAAFNFSNVCEGVPHQFTDASTLTTGNINQWQWDFGNGQTSSQQNTSVNYGSEGIFTTQLIVLSAFGCSDTISQEVIAYPLPEVSFLGDVLEGCEPHTVNFQDLSTIPSGTITGWNWDFGDGGNSAQQTPSYVYQQYGLYDVALTLTSDNNCVSSVSLDDYIRVYPKPAANFTWSPQQLYINKNVATFGNQTTGGQSYVWDFGDGFGSTVENPTHGFPVTDTGTYVVTLVATSDFGCIDSIRKNITVLPSPTLYLPNSFTPNRDGLNDIFIVEGQGLVSGEMLIFNRWGEELAHIKSPDLFVSGWNGLDKNGNLYPQGTYAYRITVYDIFNQEYSLFGHINLLP